MAKTIVFCEDIDLASKNPEYVMQITGDNLKGKMEFDNFIDPEKPCPVIATTSRLMTTGVGGEVFGVKEGGVAPSPIL